MTVPVEEPTGVSCFPARTSVRFATLALVFGLAFAASPRRSEADCHVAEKPVLGLSGGEDLLLFRVSEGLTRLEAGHPARAVPKPCSGELPGGLERENPAGLIALMAAAMAGPTPPTHRLIPQSVAVHPIHRATIPDRPPRA